MDRIIGIGEYDVSNNVNDVLKTYALSSCVALTIYDPVKRVLGMAHIALPSLQSTPAFNPAYYADIGIPVLIRKFCMGYGCNKENFLIKLFGGAESVKKDVFNIGMKNIAMVETVLKKYNLKINHYDTRGNKTRSIAADVATGTVKVKYQPLCF